MTTFIHTTKETTHINIGDFSNPLQVIGKTVPVELARAAPDLIRALEKVCNELDHSGEFSCVNEARKIIAKARGQA
jgi:hypothetical protein